MPVKHFLSKKIILLTLLVLYCSFASAQSFKKINARIDSLMKAGLPKSALIEVDKLDKLAHKNNNVPLQVQVVLYRIALQYATDENAQVAIINRLKTDVDKAEYPVKPVLQSLLASMYQQYYQENRWKFAQRTQLEKPGDDFTNWDLQAIIDHISTLFKLSVQDYIREQATPISVLDGVLAGDKATRYLRPALYDLLAQRALDYFLSEEPAITRPKQPFTLDDPRLFSDSHTFAGLKIKTADTGSTFYQGIKLLQQTTLFHLQKQNEDALADLDLQRLGFIFAHSSMPKQDSLYLKAIDGIAAKFSSSPISADALVLHGKYYQDKDSLKTALIYFSKAVAAFPKSLGGKNASGYIGQIKRKELTAMAEDVNMPGRPILAQLTYRNVKTAHLTIYKVWATQYNELARMPSDDGNISNGIIQTSNRVLNYLKNLTPVKVEDLQLPDPQDYRSHTTEFKIDPLQMGIYVLVVNDPSSNDPSLMQLTTFKVSRLSFTARRNPDSKLQISVMDRETGAPIPGVNVTIAETEHQTTDANGICFSNFKADNGYSVKLTTKNDTLYFGQRYNGYFYNNTGSSTILFTDRQIYRPGQTVYFKGLHIQIRNGKSTLLFNEKRTVYIKDGNNKDIASIPVSSNEFGSFSGTFIIPQNILNGSVSINTTDGNKDISVEEYKRPTFSVEFTPVQHSYKPNDSVTLKGSVTAYSGYGISQARVAYHITRQYQVNYYPSGRIGGIWSRNEEIATDTIKTNDRGEFEIKFKAAADELIKNNGMNYRFAVNADVTDGSGETRSANSSLTVAINNLQVIADVPDVITGRDSIRIAAQIENLDGVMQSGAINLKVYSLKAPGHLFKTRLWERPDQNMLSAEQYKNDFPDYAYGKEDNKDSWAVQNNVAEINKDADGKIPVNFNLDALKKQPTGYYKILISAKGEHGDTTSSARYVYVVNSPAKPQLITNWTIPVKTNVKTGQSAEILLGIGQPVQVLMEKFRDSILLSSQWLNITDDKQQLIKIPGDTGKEKITVQFLMVYQNRLYTNRYLITNEDYSDKLKIRFLTFRNKLQPGEKEQWKLQITGSNKEKEAAEMVADLYDASLDALTSGGDDWSQILNSRYIYDPRYFYWDNNFVVQVQSQPLKYNNEYFNPVARLYEQLSLPGYNEPNRIFTALNGRVGGIQIRGISSAAMATVTFKAPFAKADSETLGYNSQPDQKVVMREIQTKPGQKFNKQLLINATAQLTGINTRKNFNETAFFYPQLQTNEKGEIVIDFTIPESLTKWHFKGFAHTKDLKTGYIESELVTQKQLSITANTPRFLREGDTIIISARLANLTPSKLKGKVQLQLLNALNMQPVSLFINAADAQQNFEVDSNSNKAISFKLFIPAGLSAVTYRLTAESGSYSDGEENTLPVLPNRMLVTESMPMMVRAGQSKAFTFDKLVNQTSTTLKNKTLTLEYTQNPAWYAVQALPYMMEFPYECSEQVFSRYYANSLATNLVNKMPVIKQVFDQWKSINSTELFSNLEKNEELKSTLIEETPWLKDAVNESEQKKRIALLFDLNKMSYELQLNLDKLQKKQLPDGSFPWFGGNYADRYITQNVLAGIGQLYHLGIADSQNKVLKDVADKAMSWLDNAMLADAAAWKRKKIFDKREIEPLEIHSYYTQSYFTARDMSADLKALLHNYLQLAEKQWVNKSVYEKAMIALTMQRNQKPGVAAAIIKSLIETAQQSDDMGMYWAKNQRGYYWYQSPVETQSLMIELFTEVGNNPKAVEEMKIWLLRSKQTSNWQTTKATAAACYALLLKGDNWLADQSVPDIKLGGKDLLELKPDVKADAGTGYIKTTWIDEQIKPGLGKMQLNNTGKTISWGALHWQYLENLDKITPSSTDIHLERKYFIVKQGNAGQILTVVDAAHQPKTGDLLKVVVYLTAGRDFEYVQLKDMRPAGTEPVDVLSTYKYQDGLYYYQVTKDVATNFFISSLSKGNYVFEYRLRVAQPGNFSTGISTVQCMYAPEFNAHSEGMRIEIKP